MDRPRKYPFQLYFWNVPNPQTGRMRKTRYRMTESDAMRFPGAVKIETDALLVANASDYDAIESGHGN